MCANTNEAFPLAKITSFLKWSRLYNHDGIWRRVLWQNFGEIWTNVFRTHTFSSKWDDCWIRVHLQAKERSGSSAPTRELRKLNLQKKGRLHRRGRRPSGDCAWYKCLFHGWKIVSFIRREGSGGFIWRCWYYCITCMQGWWGSTKFETRIWDISREMQTKMFSLKTHIKLTLIHYFKDE